MDLLASGASLLHSFASTPEQTSAPDQIRRREHVNMKNSARPHLFWEISHFRTPVTNFYFYCPFQLRATKFTRYLENNKNLYHHRFGDFQLNFYVIAICLIHRSQNFVGIEKLSRSNQILSSDLVLVWRSIYDWINLWYFLLLRFILKCVLIYIYRPVWDFMKKGGFELKNNLLQISLQLDYLVKKYLKDLIDWEMWIIASTR